MKSLEELASIALPASQHFCLICLPLSVLFLKSLERRQLSLPSFTMTAFSLSFLDLDRLLLRLLLRRNDTACFEGVWPRIALVDVMGGPHLDEVAAGCLALRLPDLRLGQEDRLRTCNAQ